MLNLWIHSYYNKTFNGIAQEYINARKIKASFPKNIPLNMENAVIIYTWIVIFAW